MDVLVTYDISTVDAEGQRRLTRIASICERYGVRVQYSVFECRLTEVRLTRLTIELEQAIDDHADSVCIYRMPGSLESSRTTLGRSIAPRLGRPWII